MEISVMMERKVRFGFRYRSARKKLNGRLKACNGCRKVGRSPNVKKVTRDVSPRLRDRDVKEGAELSELSTRSDQSRNRVL